MTFELPNAVAAMNDAVAARAVNLDSNGGDWGRIGEDVAKLAGLAAAIDNISGVIKAGREQLAPDWDGAAVEEIEKTLDDYATAVKAVAAGMETALTEYTAYREATANLNADEDRVAVQLKSDVDELFGQAMEALRQLSEARPFAALSAPASPAAVEINDVGRTIKVTALDGDGHVKVTVEDADGGKKSYDLDFNAASGMGRAPSDGPSAHDIEHVLAGTNGKCVIEDGALTITAERSLFDEAAIILTVDGGTDKPTTHTLDFAAEDVPAVVSVTAASTARPPATTEPHAARRPVVEADVASVPVAAEENVDPSPAAAASSNSAPVESDTSAGSSVAESAAVSGSAVAESDVASVPVAAEENVDPSPAAGASSNSAAESTVIAGSGAESTAVPSPATGSDASSGSPTGESGAAFGSAVAESDVASVPVAAEENVDPSPAAAASSNSAAESTVTSSSVGAESAVASSPAVESAASSGSSAVESVVASGSVVAGSVVASGSPAVESDVVSGRVADEPGMSSGSVPAELEAVPSPEAEASRSPAVESDVATSSVAGEPDAAPSPAVDAPSPSEASTPAVGEPAGTNPQGDPSGTLSGVLVPEQPADATGSAVPMMAGAGVAAGGDTGIGWSVHGDLFDSGDPVYSVHGVLGEDDLKSQ